MSESPIDLVKYGVLWQKVENMEQKIDKLETGMEELLKLANQGRGGVWAGMAIISALSSISGYIVHFFQNK